MTDIFQEVEQDLRRERFKSLWDRFGAGIIALAVAIVIGVAGWRLYEGWATAQERAAGDRFVAALAEAETADTPDALLSLAEEAPEGIALLARFRAAAEHRAAGQTEEAAEVLRGLVANAPDLYGEVARVRLAGVLVDLGDRAGVEEAVGALAEDSASPFHAAAQEMMGLAAFAADDVAAARRWFEALQSGAATAPDAAQRAGLMLALIDQTTARPAEAAADSAAADAPVAEETN